VTGQQKPPEFQQVSVVAFHNVLLSLTIAYPAS